MATEPQKPVKVKVLVVGDGGVSTGIARITHNILINLPKEFYEIHQLAPGYRGDPHEESWKLYTTFSGGDAYGFNRLKEMVEKIKPEIVFTINDPWIQAEYLKTLKEFSEKLKIITYTAVDSGPIDPDWLKDYQCVSRFVVYTNYAKNEVFKALNLNEYPKLRIIPHGVDTRVFYPFKDGDDTDGSFLLGLKKAKKLLRVCDNDDEIEHSFIVLNANRNQPRKRIDITIKGFSEFAKDKPKDVKLYLHMGTEDMGWNILKLAKRHGIDERLIITKNENTIPGIADENLNLIFNACDIGINTSACEGWGLPNFEHAATCRAQIVPKSFSSAEIWNECAEFVDPRMEITYERTLTSGKIIGSEDVAASLEKLYADVEYRNKVARACYEKVTRPEFQWSNIALLWHQLFQEVLDSKN